MARPRDDWTTGPRAVVREGVTVDARPSPTAPRENASARTAARRVVAPVGRDPGGVRC
jgi:hypothetical protein